MATLTLNKVRQNIFKYAVGLSTAAVLGGLAIASPAQAVAPTGNLSFSDGADDFFGEVNAVTGDTFDIQFNLGGVAFLGDASGDFVPPFDVNDIYGTVGVATSTGLFEYVSGNNATGFTYKLTNDLNFTFADGGTVTWVAGTFFDGKFSAPGTSVQFKLQEGHSLLAKVTGIGENVYTVASTFTFSDNNAPGSKGGYEQTIAVARKTPEPTALFGLGMVAAGVAVSRRKKGFKTIIG